MSPPTSQTPNVDIDVSPVSPEITIEKISHEDCQLTITSNESDVLDSSYEIVEPEEVERPSISLEKKFPDDTAKSVKDRMFLSTGDAAATLLFTQTVTSPMLTPSEENIDFLKGFQRDLLTSESTTSNDSPHDSNKQSEENSTSESNTEPGSENLFKEPLATENIYENTEFLKRKRENIYENLQDCKNLTDNIYQNIEVNPNVKDDIEEHEEHIYQDIEECKKEGLYEEVSDIKTITSQMISDEIMVENSLYNNIDELNLHQVDEMVTDLDLTEDSVDPDKIYETIKTAEEVSTHNTDYDAVLIHSEVVSTPSDMVETNSEIPYRSEIMQQNVESHSENVPDEIKNIPKTCEIIQSDSETIPDQSQSVITNNADNAERVDLMQESMYEPRVFPDERAQGDGSKVIIDSNNCRDSEVSSIDSNEKTKESYSEFIHHSKTESNYYEKYTKVVSNSIKNTEICNREKDTETVPPEIVKTLKSQFSKNTSEISTPTKKDVEDATELRAINIMKQINKFENKDVQVEDVSTLFTISRYCLL